ncbi:hypothetical protein L484_011750 [Morus notabilis]|uniref:Uncharacterized protein n=1 Tax=Morus notabilis TaxID=981085 RepID=W9RLI0_9ROSA|nr:hypothetical protein L484_011750 [Morus notabilis]
MKAAPTWLNTPFLSFTFQSQFFGFSAAQPFLAHNDVAPSLTLTHRSTRLLSNAGVFMALVDPDSSYDNPDYVEVIIVRHGETAWNADGRIQKYKSSFLEVMQHIGVNPLMELGCLEELDKDY